MTTSLHQSRAESGFALAKRVIHESTDPYLVSLAASVLAASDDIPDIIATRDARHALVALPGAELHGTAADIAARIGTVPVRPDYAAHSGPTIPLRPDMGHCYEDMQDRQARSYRAAAARVAAWVCLVTVLVVLGVTALRAAEKAHHDVRIARIIQENANDL